MSGRQGPVTIHIFPGKCAVIEDKSVWPDEDITEELPQADNNLPGPSGTQGDGAPYAPPSPRYSPIDNSQEGRGADFGELSPIPEPSTGRDNDPNDGTASAGEPQDTSIPTEGGGIVPPQQPAIESSSDSSDSEDDCQIVGITALGPINWVHEARRGLAVSGGRVSIVHVGKPVSTFGHSGWSSVTSATPSTSSPRPRMFARNTSQERGSSPNLLPTNENFVTGELRTAKGRQPPLTNDSPRVSDSTITGLPDLDVSMVMSELSKIERSDSLISLLHNCKEIRQRQWTFIEYQSGEIKEWGEKYVCNNLERDIKHLYLQMGSELPSQKTLRNRATFDRLLVPEGGREGLWI